VVQNKTYEVNRTVTRTVGPDAKLSRLTVAVLVDGTYTEAEDGSESVFTPRSEEELAELKSVIESAVGFDAARGDRIELASVRFRDRPSTSLDGAEGAPALPPWLPYAVGGAALALVAIAWMVFARRRKKARVVQAEVLQFPATVEQTQQAVQAAEQGRALQGIQRPALPGKVSPPAAEVIELAAADPERTADVIRMWMAADEDMAEARAGR
jgi:flagellar M-ring protein FliF